MKKFYLMMIAMLCMAFASSAKEYTGAVWLLYGSSWTEWEDGYVKVQQTFDIEDQTVTVKNFLNSSFDYKFTYDLDEGTISSNLAASFKYIDFTIEDRDFTGIYSYGDSSFWCENDEDFGKVVSGYFCLYDTDYVYVYMSIYLDELTEVGAAAEGTSVASAYSYAMNYETGKYETGETFDVPVIVNGGQVQFPNFLGSDVTISANVFESNPVFSDFSTMDWTLGSFTLDGVTYTSIKNQGHKFDKFGETEDGQYLTFSMRLNSDATGSAYKYIYIFLPADAQVTPIADINWSSIDAQTVQGRTVSTAADKDVTYSVEAKFTDGAVYVPNFLGSKQDLEVAYEGNKILGITSDGTFWDANNYGFYTETEDIIRFFYTYGDETKSNELYFNAESSEANAEEGYVKVNARVEYPTFDGSSVDWSGSWATRTEDFYIYLPGTTGVSTIAVDNNSNAPVEYYNLNGVRVNGENLASGLYIRRQGNKATKVLVK